MKSYLMVPIYAVVLITIVIGLNAQHQFLSIGFALVSIVLVPMIMAYTIKACNRQSPPAIKLNHHE